MPEPDDWAVLGLAPGASGEEARLAYQRRVALYSPDSLATYSLLSNEERNDRLARIEAAYRSIAGGDAGPSGGSEPAVDATSEPPPAVRSSLPPDRLTAPGAYMRHHREALGLSLAQVTARTKIRGRVLEALESEDFAVLPAAVYVRGFVLQIARLLRLPESGSLAEDYLARMRDAGSE